MGDDRPHATIIIGLGINQPSPQNEKRAEKQYIVNRRISEFRSSMSKSNPVLSSPMNTTEYEYTCENYKNAVNGIHDRS